jgi:Flp pilus assembly pilin Flp
MTCTIKLFRRRERGAMLVELALVGGMLIVTIFGTLEITRMLLVYTTVTHAADAGLRYAIVHGHNKLGAGADGPSGPSANPTQVLNVIKYYTAAGSLNPNNLTISVTYPDTTGNGNDPGQHVRVRVSYAYDPFTAFFPLAVNLSGETQGIITF